MPTFVKLVAFKIYNLVFFSVLIHLYKIAYDLNIVVYVLVDIKKMKHLKLNLIIYTV